MSRSSIFNTKGYVPPQAGGGGGSIPMTNLHRWYDANDSATLLNSSNLPASNGQGIETWRDKSGNNGHLTRQYGQAPILTTNVVNGKPVVRFTANGKTDGTQLRGTQSLGSSSYTVFLVSQWRDLHRTYSIDVLFTLGSESGSGGEMNIGSGGADWGIYTAAGGGFTLENPTILNAFKISSINCNKATSTSTMYLDGINKGNRPTNNNPVDNPLILGSWVFAGGNAPEYFADADIAEVIIYNASLSDTDRQQVENYLNTKYNLNGGGTGGGSGGSSTIGNGLISYWNLDDTSWADSKGTNNLTMVGTVGSSTGKVNNAANFNRSSNSGCLRSNNRIIPNTDSSLQCWFYCTQNLAGQNVMLLAGDYYRTPLSIGLGQNTNNVYAYVTCDWTGSNPTVATSFNLNTWYHAVATNDAANKVLKFYLNGNLVGSQSYSGTPGSNLQGGGFVIGSTWDNVGSYETIGKVDEVGVWNRVLTADEVTALYASGNGNPYPFSSGGSPLLTNLLAYWPLSEAITSGSRADATGHGHTLLDNRNNVTYASNGRGGNAAVFSHNSTSSLITQDGNILLPTTAFSVSLWVKITNSGQSAEIIGNVTGNNWAGGGLQMDYNGNGTLTWGAIYGNPNSYNRFTTASSNIANGNWHHLVGTYNNGNKKVYIDGNILSQQNDPSTTPIGGNGSCHISLGSNSDNSYSPLNMDGQLSDVGLWNRELTSSEVTSLYAGGNGLSYPFNTGGGSTPSKPAKILIKGYTPPTPPASLVTTGLTSWLDFSNSSSYPGTGTTINDLSPNSGNAVMVNGASYDSGLGGEISLNGSNQYIRTNNDLGQYYSSTNQSIFIWVKPSAAGQIVTEVGFFNTGWIDSQIEIHNDGTIRFSTWHNNVNYPQKVVSSPQAFNQWYLLGFTYNGTTLTAYINGQAIGTTNLTRSAPYNGGYGLAYYLGYASPTNMGVSAYFNGKIGAFYTYNRALTPTETLQNFNSTRSRYIGGGPPKFKILVKGYQKPAITGPTYSSGLYGQMYYDNGNYDASFSDGPNANDPTFFANHPQFKTQHYIATEIFNFYVNGSGIQNLDNYGNFGYNGTDAIAQYSWEFLGYFRAPYSDNFTFKTWSDDASYLWIGNNAISGFTTSNCAVNNGGSHGNIQSSSSSIPLVGGVYYPIRIQYGQGGGYAILTVAYSSSTETNVTNWSGKAFYNPATNGF
jgi:hypothetical protein